MKNRVALLVAMVLGLTMGSARGAVLFSDNFDSYAAGTNLGDTDAWSTDIDQYGSMRANSEGRIVAINNWYGAWGVVYVAYVDGLSLQDGIASVDGYNFPGQYYGGYWEVVGRYDGTDYVWAEALPSDTNSDGVADSVWLRAGDTLGVKEGDYYVGPYDSTLPVNVAVKMEGTTITATVTHGTSTYSLSFETSVTAAGAPGFAAPSFPYGYTVVKFDNFEVDDLAPAVTPGDANKDGKVDVGDLGILAANYGRDIQAEGVPSEQWWGLGDFTGDGKVDVGDLGVLAANYGSGTTVEADFNADYAKVVGTAAEEKAAEDTTSSACSSLGLSLIVGLTLMGLMLVKLED